MPADREGVFHASVDRDAHVLALLAHTAFEHMRDAGPALQEGLTARTGARTVPDPL